MTPERPSQQRSKSMRYPIVLLALLSFTMPSSAKIVQELSEACQTSEKEQLFAHPDSSLLDGVNIGVHSLPATVIPNEHALMRWCDVPEPYIIHCHVQHNAGSRIPSSYNSDGDGDIAFLVYHEELCRARRALLGYRTPITHGFVDVPRMRLTLYRLGTHLNPDSASRWHVRDGPRPAVMGSRTVVTQPPPSRQSWAVRAYERILEMYRVAFPLADSDEYVPERIFRPYSAWFQVRTIPLE